ncbi:uncharacterized protein A4U43_C01F17310 [Asparagus officinalis]|uniref:Uncharacterized protein n=1 Tax=Asparagus officinalis TaxID=4686 RepID=A0A5P1FQ28_ASPOF|nr:uncharacterized protein A4U43_C01F17310 [Asparagus officinalis]
MEGLASEGTEEGGAGREEEGEGVEVWGGDLGEEGEGLGEGAMAGVGLEELVEGERGGGGGVEEERVGVREVWRVEVEEFLNEELEGECALAEGVCVDLLDLVHYKKRCLVRFLAHKRNGQLKFNFDKGMLYEGVHEDRMVKLLQIALKCIYKSTDARPTMSQVAEMIHSLKEEEDRSVVSEIDSRDA